ncbi:hypothetical protein [Altererythrobacter sp. Root672]|uniref:hypothetical protein n=1 Tax=Altererythrobacter sp. Root672 TaxID=1736584 RepID=UPI0006FB4AD2|nr:hypothetical protein [Altererythrobacter sp. Root672]KRA84179.1 hypothetical protein ASD76_09360 [Altererythrobacter sp. Root672]
MSKTLKTIGLVLGAAALLIALPGVGAALGLATYAGTAGLSVATVTTILTVASAMPGSAFAALRRSDE